MFGKKKNNGDREGYMGNVCRWVGAGADMALSANTRTDLNAFAFFTTTMILPKITFCYCM